MPFEIEVQPSIFYGLPSVLFMAPILADGLTLGSSHPESAFDVNE